MMKKIAILILLSCIFLMTSCTDDDIVIDPVIEAPTTYSFTRDGASTVSFSGQTARINMGTELITAMTDVSQNSETLVEMYANQSASGEDANPYTDPALNESTKSIKSKVAASADFFATNNTESAIIKADIESWIVSQVTEVFPNQNVLAEKGIAGQIAGDSSVRYVNAQGLEYDQAVNKALIGALMVDQICNNYLSPTVLNAGENIANNDADIVEDGAIYTSMEHKWDEAYGYLFGIATDARDPLATLGEGNFLNKYLLRVEDDTDFAGIASDIFDAFKLGRTAIVLKDYTLRDEQVAILKEKISQVIAIRAVYSLQNGKNALAAQNFGGAFHNLSEGFGFVYSLRFISLANSTDPYFSKSEVDGFINQMIAENGFWDLDAATLDQISEAIAAKFSFTVAQAAE